MDTATLDRALGILTYNTPLFCSKTDKPKHTCFLLFYLSEGWAAYIEQIALSLDATTTGGHKTSQSCPKPAQQNSTVPTADFQS